SSDLSGPGGFRLPGERCRRARVCLTECWLVLPYRLVQNPNEIMAPGQWQAIPAGQEQFDDGAFQEVFFAAALCRGRRWRGGALDPDACRRAVATLSAVQPPDRAGFRQGDDVGVSAGRRR